MDFNTHTSDSSSAAETSSSTSIIPVNTSSLKCNREAALTHLQTLGCKDGDKVCLRFFYPANDPRKAQDQGRNLDATYPNLPWAEIERLQAEGRGCYVVVNPGGHKDADITEVRAIFYEHDSMSKENQLTLHHDLDLPEPTIQIDTGGKSIHTYFVLETPALVEKGKELQTQLLNFVDGDRSIKNPSRVMRLAGAWYINPGQKPTQTKIVSCSGKRHQYDHLASLVVPKTSNEKPVLEARVPVRGGQGLDALRAKYKTWYELKDGMQLPVDVEIPLEICLTTKNREYINEGVAEGGRNNAGYALISNAMATARDLDSIGQRYFETPETLFRYFCAACNPPH